MTEKKARIKDQQLYLALRPFLKSLISKFEKDIPQKESKKVSKRDDHWTVSTVREPDFQRLVAYSRRKWEDLPGYSEFVKLLLSNNIYRKNIPKAKDQEGRDVENPNLDEWYIQDRLLAPLITTFLEEKEELEFDEEIFDTIYHDFENYLFADSLTYRSWAALEHFQMKREELKLSPEIRIRKMKDEERNYLAEQEQTAFGIHMREKMMDFIIETNFSIGKDMKKDFSKFIIGLSND